MTVMIFTVLILLKLTFSRPFIYAAPPHYLCNSPGTLFKFQRELKLQIKIQLVISIHFSLFSFQPNLHFDPLSYLSQDFLELTQCNSNFEKYTKWPLPLVIYNRAVLIYLFIFKGPKYFFNINIHEIIKFMLYCFKRNLTPLYQR